MVTAFPLIGFGTLLFIAIGIAKFCEGVLLSDSQKRQLHEKLIDVWHSLDDADAATVIQSPIRLLSTALGFALGQRIFSKAAFLRSIGIGALVFVFMSVVNGIHQGKSTDGYLSPSESFDVALVMIKAAPDLIEASDKEQKITKEQKEQVHKIADEVSAIYSPENRLLYKWAFIPSVMFVAVALNFFSIAFARQSVRDMADAKSLLSLFSLGLSNLFALACFALLAFTLLCSIAIPIAWPIVWGLIECGQRVSWLLASGLVIPGIVLAFLLGPEWVRMLAGAIVVPEFIAIIIAVCAFLLFPFRKPIRRVVLFLIDRGVTSKNGILAFFIVVVTTALEVISQLAKLFGVKMPFT